MTGQRTPAEIEADGRSALDDLAAMYRHGAEAVIGYVLEETGQDITPAGRPSVMDARLADLAHMEAQAQHFLAAMRLVRQWIAPSETVRLGDRLKTVPTDVAEQIEAHLARTRLA